LPAGFGISAKWSGHLRTRSENIFEIKIVSDAIIQVENISKRYLIGQRAASGDGLRHIIENTLRAPQRWLRERREQRTAAEQEFWALKEVSFEIKRGEVVGIIGRNGAGKSTLLKILSRITEPSSGRITLDGRVASLLEVGTGFHQELTGRENIFLNGAILGMSRVEIKRKFDEIVAFSEVEKFLDTPVKRYSSGMYVRLAFAVAAHLEPEILIVDEVLAVGDQSFQKKCLQKMEGMSSHGRTVIFVSHQIAAVTRLCRSALWLDAGRVREFGRSDLICSHYLANGQGAVSSREWAAADGPVPGSEWVRLERVEVMADGKPADRVDIKSSIEVTLDFEVLKNGKILIPNIHLYAEDGTLIFIAHDWHSGWRTRPKTTGKYRTKFCVPGNFFSEGRITVRVAISTYDPFEIHINEADVVAFNVIESEAGDTARGDFAGHLPGIIRPLIKSETNLIL
jgi:lipopolysaccharide transport system ATP-binding protein